MSLCISASLENEHIIAVDTAVSTPLRGAYYRIVNEESQKIVVDNNEAYFFSGDVILSQHLRKIFFEQKNRDFCKLANIAKTLFKQMAELGDELAFAKYGFDSDGNAYTQYTHNYSDFEPSDKCYGHPKYRYMCYGANMDKASDELKKYIKTNVVTPEFFVPLFQAVVDEKVGGSIIVYRLTANMYEHTDKIKLKEPDSLKKFYSKKQLGFIGSGADANPIDIFGDGDGIVVTPDNSADSGKAYHLKQNGSMSYCYHASNTSDIRQLLFHDDKLQLLAKNVPILMDSKGFNIVCRGDDLHIQHDSGSQILMKSDGSIEFKAVTDITMECPGTMTFNSHSVDFNQI